MPIHAPGYRPVNKRLRGSKKRGVVAQLSLTAMVDMFTVLTIFLLQNYNPETGAVLDMQQDIVLPQAKASKDLKPAHVVIISLNEVRLEKRVLAQVDTIKRQKAWMIQPLYNQLQKAIRFEEQKQKKEFANKFSKAVDKAINNKEKKEDFTFDKVTVQADKSVNFEIIKKVMYTANAAGAGEVNFAIMQK